MKKIIKEIVNKICSMFRKDEPISGPLCVSVETDMPVLGLYLEAQFQIPEYRIEPIFDSEGVVVTYLPTGISVTVKKYKTRSKNIERALEILKKRLEKH